MGYEIDIAGRVRAYLRTAEPGLEQRLCEALGEIAEAAEELHDGPVLRPAVKLYFILGRHRFDYEIDREDRRVRVLSGFTAP